MANAFYDPGSGRAGKVGELFASIAPRYDLINDLQSFGLHRHWKRRLVALTGVGPGTKALDVCCGTGDIAFALAQRGAQVTGLDFSPAMLAVAERRRLRNARPGGTVKFVQGDALKLPFPDNSFTAVTVGYGLRNLASWEQGLREMRRVAAPGGWLAVLDFGKPDHPLWRAAYFGYLRLGVPLLGLLFCGRPAAYGYILESLRHYPAQRELARKLAELGLVGVHTVNLLGGVMSLHAAAKPR